jgi:antitoxin (DNA-binding transcriptional repressor) of toxin-antitoxin stability system
MRSMTETEAMRRFASMLREVANGETVLVTTDDGAPFARIEPDRTTAVERLAALREKHPPNPEFGDHLEKVVRELRESTDDGVREWLWDDK